jgi:hypothetical protein
MVGKADRSNQFRVTPPVVFSDKRGDPGEACRTA